MLVHTIPAAAVPAAPCRALPAGRPLAGVEGELFTLCQRLAALQTVRRATGGTGGAPPAWHATLQLLRVHLFLTASQLLPVWRDMCRDTRTVDRVEVRLDQLRALTEQTLAAGADDVMAEARCAVLAEELQRHRLRSVVLLRALDAVADPDSLRALAEVWTREGARLRRASRHGQPLGMDNEDADPVGRPPL